MRDARASHIRQDTTHQQEKNRIPLLPPYPTHRACFERQPSVSLILGTLLWFSPAQFVDSVPK